MGREFIRGRTTTIRLGVLARNDSRHRKLSASVRSLERGAQYPKQVFHYIGIWNHGSDSHTQRAEELPQDRRALRLRVFCMEKIVRNSQEKVDQVPTRASASEKTTNLITLSDETLLAEWDKARRDITTGREFTHRGWCHAPYADGMHGK